MLLCEVALGKMCECVHATTYSPDKLPTGTQSVKGRGQTAPDPKGTTTTIRFFLKIISLFLDNYITDDGVLIPMGRGVNANVQHSSLLYNEYIVYNTDQIKIKYLLRVEFDYKD